MQWTETDRLKIIQVISAMMYSRTTAELLDDMRRINLLSFASADFLDANKANYAAEIALIEKSHGDITAVSS